jgi:hypothetical protein
VVVQCSFLGCDVAQLALLPLVVWMTGIPISAQHPSVTTVLSTSSEEIQSRPHMKQISGVEEKLFTSSLNIIYKNLS